MPYGRRVVVTGMGAVTPIGNTLPEFWSGLISGKNGIDLISKFDATNFDTKFAAEVKNFNAEAFIDGKAVRRLDLFAQFAIASSQMAIDDSQIDLSKIDNTRAGVVYGSGIGGVQTFQDVCFSYFSSKKPQKISPFFITMMIPDIAAGHISIRFGFKGPNYSTVSACATSSHAIADAFMLIQRGSADIMICGGSEAPITELSIGGFNSMRALSTWNDRYTEASRPFDKDRSGFVMGEGSGTLVLEELQHALDRGARIYAEIGGVGLTADAHHITAPDPTGDGATRSMQCALQDAGLQSTDIDYINAHGTSTSYNDVTETKAIKNVFGEHAYSLAVSSIKSMTGHLLGAAGGIEAIATVMTVANDIIPPTINYTTPDPECDLFYCPNTAVKRPVNVALSNTFGFGGHNATLLFKKFLGA
jgi:3-oxoacyl-[acyl-carrier-protein] synthase II